ncbi:hypothetical protein B0H19DRAFT_1235411 [Mycena capillaripes]|nr:hypothetical protein B0H19DRAFT_1235411 [Mycena capillaripes]
MPYHSAPIRRGCAKEHRVHQDEERTHARWDGDNRIRTPDENAGEHSRAKRAQSNTVTACAGREEDERDSNEDLDERRHNEMCTAGGGEGAGETVHSGAAVKSKWTGSSGRSEPKLNSTPTPKYKPNLNHKTASRKMLSYVLFGGGRIVGYNSKVAPGELNIAFSGTTGANLLVFYIRLTQRTGPQKMRKYDAGGFPSSSQTDGTRRLRLQNLPGELFLEPAGRVELLAGAAGYKAGRPSSYAVRGVRTSGKTLLGDLDSDPDLREVGLERRADGWPL